MADLVFFRRSLPRQKVVSEALGALRIKHAMNLDLLTRRSGHPCWVVDFPMV